MAQDPLPPPDWPPPPPPPPPPAWPPPPAPARSGRAAAVAVAGGALTLLVVFVGGAAVLLSWLDEPVPGPGYVRLTDDEVADTVARAEEVGAELDRWWEQQLAEHSDPWRFVAVGDRLTDGDDGVTCDGDPVTAEDELLDNAWAALCREGPVVAFDPATFRRSDVALRVILAHEWGHVGQALDRRLDEIEVDRTAVYAETELQADCYAGAWAATAMTAEEHELAVLELRAIGDPESVPLDDPDGHGTPDEREAAFRLGIERGITACLPDQFDAR